MNRGEIFRKIRDFSQKKMAKVDIPAHDFKHVTRVRNWAIKIGKAEKQDLFLIETAAWLHDVGRAEVGDKQDHGKVSAKISEKFLKNFPEITTKDRKLIVEAIREHSDRWSSSWLGHTLQDADKLDGLGAIGLMRAMMSKYHLQDYNAQRPFYRQKPTRTIIDHLYYLLEWEKMFYSRPAKKLAKPRLKIIKDFLKELKYEINQTRS